MCVGFNRRSLDTVVMTSGAVAYYYRLMQVCQLLVLPRAKTILIEVLSYVKLFYLPVYHAEYFRQLLKPTNTATNQHEFGQHRIGDLMQGDPGYGYGGYGYGYGYGYSGAGYDMAGYGSGGGYYTSDPYPAAPAAYEDPLAGRRQHDFPAPLTSLEFQPSDTCPKNYVIFDQTYDRSRVMFHPSLANNFGNSGGYDHHCYGFDQDYAGKSAYYGVDDDGGECSIRQKEDTDEIDALMSTEDSEEEDDVLSTGRTPGCRAGGSPDSTCSSGYGVSTGASRSNGGDGRKPEAGGERKKERMKKMMRTVKGIIPGGDRMDTPAVLDEAVRYLKSLKVEVKKLGVRGSSS